MISESCSYSGGRISTNFVLASINQNNESVNGGVVDDASALLLKSKVSASELRSTVGCGDDSDEGDEGVVVASRFFVLTKNPEE